MSVRNDIIDLAPGTFDSYGLIYTRKCGWIDLGHARPSGASKLLQDIRTGRALARANPTFPFEYLQPMARLGVQVKKGEAYTVNTKLSDENIRRVALSIFMRVSVKFEELQNNWLFSLLGDSGFSCEDLVSDLLGFYRAVNPNTDYIRLCEPTSKEYALKIWDKFGPVGTTKMDGFGIYLHNIDERTGAASSMSAKLPEFLTTIRPAPQGPSFFEPAHSRFDASFDPVAFGRGLKKTINNTWDSIIKLPK